ncbi:hypothetical protein ACP70R_023940 [Stipagrostis hirtigluma subsp. patula]
MGCLDSIVRLFKDKGKREYSINDSRWPEVRFINGYAVFMGYLMMGVRGLGILVVTWTTVVLLGGYVSVLGKKDFWCLTGITLVQTAGVFNFLLEEKLSDILHSTWGLLGAAFATVIKEKKSSKKDQQSSSRNEKEGIDNSEARLSAKRFVLACVASVIQLLVLAIILCPLAVLYLLGLYISAGVSLWRLIEHDFGNADGGANLKPALKVLYSLAVAQGALFGYKKMHAFWAKIGLAEFVAKQYCSVDQNLVSDYLDSMVKGCEKDPSFATGRNLITYATDLMLEPKSNDGLIAGVRALGTIIKNNREWGRPVLAKHLLTRSASRCHTIQRLLETLGPRSPYNSEIREHAARIVVLAADSIHLDQHPGGIQCISSLLDTFEEYSWRPEESKRYWRLQEYERDWLLKEYEQCYQLHERESPDSPYSTSKGSESSNLRLGHNRLVVQGLRILQDIAVNEDNCRVICNTEGLLSKIMALLTSDKLYRNHDDEWCIMALESLEFVSQFMASTHGDTRTKLQVEIASNTEAITSTLESILECGKCEVLLKRQAVQVVLDLSVDTSSIIASGSSNSIILIWMAAQSIGVVLRDLTKALVDAGNNTNRVQAAQILQHLCVWTKDDEYLKELKKAMIDVMSKVLKEMLGYGSTREEIQVVIEANNGKLSAPSTDLKNGGVSQGSGCEDTSSSHQKNGDQHEDIKWLEAQYYLCEAIQWLWIDTDIDVARELNDIAKEVCSEQKKPVKDFSGLVDEAKELLEKMKASVRAASSSCET